MKLYHITPGANVASISTEGLIPIKSEGLTGGVNGVMRIEKWRQETVWLTDDVDYILEYQASPYWIREHKAVVLEVDCSSLEIKPRGIDWYDGHEFLHKGTIPPELIKIVDILT